MWLVRFRWESSIEPVGLLTDEVDAATSATMRRKPTRLKTMLRPSREEQRVSQQHIKERRTQREETLTWRIRRVLELTAAANRTPPSGGSTAQGLGCSSGLVRTIAPEVCAPLTARYRAERAQHGMERIDAVTERIRAVCQALDQEGVYQGDYRSTTQVRIRLASGYGRQSHMRDRLPVIVQQEALTEPGWIYDQTAK